jgi:hypothetical protein
MPQYPVQPRLIPDGNTGTCGFAVVGYGPNPTGRRKTRHRAMTQRRNIGCDIRALSCMTPAGRSRTEKVFKPGSTTDYVLDNVPVASYISAPPAAKTPAAKAPAAKSPPPRRR